MVEDAPALLERDEEIAELDAALRRAGAGTGSVVVVEGPAGIGKTQLLTTARELARTQGFVVARASGSRLEQDFPFGAVRQLFEPLLAARGAATLFQGAAAAAATVLDGGTGGAFADGAPGAVLHGLYWLTVGLADEAGPLALVCDDVHWFDAPSLRFLAYLAPRLGELPVVLVVGTRPPEPGAEGELVARLAVDPAHRVLRPRALSDDGVSALVRAALQRSADPGLCDAIARLSRGNPFYVSELVRAARRAGGDGERSATELAQLTAEAAVRSRINDLSPDLLDVSRAVAVLGHDAHVRHVAALTGLDVDTVGLAADRLLRAEILGPERPLSFAHPLVATAVYQGLLPGERSAWHRRAATVLAGEGAPPDRLASHVAAAEPAGDPAAVEVLVAAARHASRQGATDVAIALLRRALAEPPAPEARAAIMLELGAAESLVFDEGAIEHLGAALAAVPPGGHRVTLAIARAVAQAAAGRAAEAVADLRALDVDGDDALALRRLGGLALVGSSNCEAASMVRAEIDELCARVGAGTDTSPDVLAVRAYVGACRGEPVEAWVDIARRALATVDPREPTLPIWFHLPLAALIMADRDEEAAAVIESHLTAVRRSGAPALVSIVLFLRALVALRAGELDDAGTDADAALELCVTHAMDFLLAGPLAIAVEVRRERDELDAAGSLLTEHDRPGLDERSVFGLFLVFARARLRGAEDRWDESFAEVHRGIALADALGCPSPGLVTWHTNLAFALVLSRRPTGAVEHARAGLEAAERFGAPRPIAEAKRALAMADPAAGADLAREAAATFADLGARLEEARSHLAISLSGGVMGTPAEGEAVAHGLWLAERSGARRLVTLATAMLRALGSGARRRPVTGLGALTASERRVAALVAAGRTNKQVAQELFITVKTVETHLARTYQKLGIASRAELADALGA